jgi:hypothetical protein
MGGWASEASVVNDDEFGVGDGFVADDADANTDDESDEDVATAFVFCGVAELVEFAGRPPGLSRWPSHADRLPIQTLPPVPEDVVCGTSTSSTCVIHSGTGS